MTQTVLKAHIYIWFQHFKSECHFNHELLSNAAFSFKLRRYLSITAPCRTQCVKKSKCDSCSAEPGCVWTTVGRVALNPKPEFIPQLNRNDTVQFWRLGTVQMV